MSETPDRSEVAAWSAPLRVLFRFGFVYLLLYNAGSFVSMLPWAGDKLSGWVAWPLEKLTGWAAVRVFHLTGIAATRHPTGSGDTAFDYVQVACFLTLALLTAAIWSAIDARRGGRREYATAYAWLRLVVRFVLAGTLLGYGYVKLFPAQFPPPSMYTMTEAYGDSSPMKLLWTFMGASKAYEIFGGLAEVVAGALLLFRRTSTLGALAAAGVLLNIVMLNLCYDVPVKLYSSHLLMMAIFLLLPDVGPMCRLLVLRRPAELHGVWVPRWERRALRVGSHVLQAVVIAGLLWQVKDAYKNRYMPPTKTPLTGLWVVNQDETGPKWGRLSVDQHALRVWDYQGYMEAFELVPKQPEHGLEYVDDGKHTTLAWAQEKKGVVLTGVIAGQPATLHLQRSGGPQFKLESTGFHWVSEYPNNH